MKKTIKKMLTAVLAIAMMVTMFAMPVSAGPDDVRTFVLMNDDMSVDHVGYPTNNAEWINGNVWAYLWTKQPNILVENGDTVIRELSTVAAGKEAVIIKNVFKGNPIKDKKSELTITYDIKTGTRTPMNQQIINKVTDKNDIDFDMSAYNTKTGAFTHMGYIDSALANSCILAENTEYTLKHEFIYDKANKSHALKITVTDKAGAETITVGEDKVSSFDCTSWDFYKKDKDIRDLKSLKYRYFYQEQAPADIDNQLLYTFQNIKVEEKVTGDVLNFGDVAYNNYGIQLTGVSQTDYDGIVAADSAAGLAGYQWAATNMNNISSSFAIDGADLSAKSKTNTLKKKFAPIKDGDTLKVSFTFKPYEYAGHSSNWNDATTLCYGDLSAIKLVGDTTNLAMFAKWRNQYNAGYLFLHEGIAQDATANYKNQSDTTVRIQGQGNHNWYETNNGTSYITVDQQGSYFEAGDRANVDGGTDYNYFQNYTTCVLTAAPNADGATYDITMTIKNQSAWRADFVATKNVPKEKILDIDALEIVTVNTEGAESPGLDRPLAKYNNISVETINANAKTALAVGENTVYLPVENVTGHAVDYAIVAAVYETGNEIPKDFAVATYKGNNKATDKLAIEGVTITNPAAEYVVCYVFDKFNTLVPHTMPISNAE